MNHRPLRPERSALSKLSYAPIDVGENDIVQNRGPLMSIAAAVLEVFAAGAVNVARRTNRPPDQSGVSETDTQGESMRRLRAK